ncbi:Hemolysin, chromosomal [compost metagenome]
MHGGGGNDIVGSLGGNDQVFGDAGDDIVFGGTGNDILSGGTGNDKLDGGLGWDTALQSGSLADYSLHQEGNALVLTHKTTGEIDHLKSIEMVKFDTGSSLYIADSDAEAAIAHIATKWLGRDLSADEGAQFQAFSHLTPLEVAQAVLRGPLASEFQGHTAQELIEGWQTNPQILRMDVVSEVVQGTAGLDAINYGLQLADGHLQWVSEGVWEGTNLTNGDMAQLHSIERVHFTDASVALDGASVAALIAVTLGGASLQDRAITSEGLSLMDSGWSNQDIGAAALKLAMGQGTHTAQDTVQWLWTKAHGSAGTNEQLLPYVQQLQAGSITADDLAWEAAQYALANPQVALTGVLQQGLVYDAALV